MKHLLSILSLLGFLTVLTAGAAGESSKKPLIFVPVLPYEYLFERIGGDSIEVHSIVPLGGDPHEYSPTPRQLTALSKANLIFSGGLPFEGNFFIAVGDGITGPKTIDLLEGLDLLEGSCSECESHHEEEEHKEGEEAEHEEHEEHKHDHGDLKDSHVWLSPTILLQQAVRIADVLKANVPHAASAIDQNLATFTTEVKTLDAELHESLAPYKGRAFYVYHGAFAYFAQNYGLEQKVIEIAGRNPTPKQITSIAKQAKAEDVKTIFVQPQFDESSALSLAETIGGKVKTLDPLEKDVLSNLRTIAATIVAGH